MKRTIAVAVILALGTTIPGPGCYEALAQDRGVRADTAFEASKGGAARETVVKPVFLQLKTDTAGPKVDFKGIWLKLSPLPIAFIGSDSRMWERMKVRGNRRMVALAQPFSTTLPGPLSVAQKETAGEVGSIAAVSIDESRSIEKVSTAFNGRKFRTGRFWRTLSQMGANIDPTWLFDGAVAPLAIVGAGNVAMPQIHLPRVLWRGDAEEREGALRKPPILNSRGSDPGAQNNSDPFRPEDFLIQLKWNMKSLLGRLEDILNKLKPPLRLNVPAPDDTTAVLLDEIELNRTQLQEHKAVDGRIKEKMTKFSDFLFRNLVRMLGESSNDGAEYQKHLSEHFDEIGRIIAAADSSETLDQHGFFPEAKHHFIRAQEARGNLFKILAKICTGLSLITSGLLVAWRPVNAEDTIISFLFTVGGVVVYASALRQLRRWWKEN